MASYRLLGISGALRKEARNTALLREAARVFDPEVFELADLRLPLYDNDLEDAEGIPPAVERLAEQIRAADAVAIATPEYNKSISGVLKNALDWISRVKGAPLRDKPVAVMSAAGGRSGGERAQFALRLCLVPFRARVLPGPELMIAGAGSAFDADGRLVNERSLAGLEALMSLLREEIARAA